MTSVVSFLHEENTRRLAIKIDLRNNIIQNVGQQFYIVLGLKQYKAETEYILVPL
jgi:hypothetical protein